VSHDSRLLSWKNMAMWQEIDLGGLERAIKVTRQLSEGRWRLTLLDHPSNNEPLLYCQLLQCDSRTTGGAVSSWLTATIGTSSGVQICVDSAPVAPAEFPRDGRLDNPYQLGLYLQQVERTFARCPGAWGKETPPLNQTNATEVQTLTENLDPDSLAPCECREGRYYYRSRTCLRWRTAKANTCAECRSVQLILLKRQSRSPSTDQQPKPRTRPEYLQLHPKILLNLYTESMKQAQKAAEQAQKAADETRSQDRAASETLRPAPEMAADLEDLLRTVVLPMLQQEEGPQQKSTMLLAAAAAIEAKLAETDPKKRKHIRYSPQVRTLLLAAPGSPDLVVANVPYRLRDP